MLPSLKDPTLRIVEALVRRIAALERRPGPNAVIAADGTRLVGSDPAVTGLAGLWLPRTFWRRPQPAQATAANDWFGGAAAVHTAVWEANFPQQQAKMLIRMIIGVTAGPTTGQYRVLVDGATVVDEWTTTNVGVLVDTRTITLPAAGWHTMRKVQVSYLRQSGTGNVYCHVTDAYTRET